jgi:hypothetical protein
MADHILTYEPTAVSPTDAVFSCSACGRRFGFNKPGFGQPQAIQSGPPANPTFSPPVGWQKSLGDCDQAVTDKTELEALKLRVAALEKKVP